MVDTEGKILGMIEKCRLPQLFSRKIAELQNTAASMEEE